MFLSPFRDVSKEVDKIAEGVELDSSVFSMPLSEAKKEFEKAYLRHILEVTDGNITEAAALSGRYRADIYRLIAKYDVAKE
jgi:two-component system response regulator GlrR